MSEALTHLMCCRCAAAVLPLGRWQGGLGRSVLGGVTVGLGAELGRVAIGWVRRCGNSIVMIIAIVVDPWKLQGSLGGVLLWEDPPPMIGLVHRSPAWLCRLLLYPLVCAVHIRLLYNDSLDCQTGCIDCFTI